MRHAAVTIFLAIWVTIAFGADKFPEHSVIRPYPGSVLAQNMSKHYSFESHEFSVINPDTGKVVKKQVKGEYWRLLYEVRNPDGSRVQDISKNEFHNNFRAAVEGIGGEILWEDPKGLLTFTIPRGDGSITYCELNAVANLGQQYLTIVDESVFKPVMSFGSSEGNVVQSSKTQPSAQQPLERTGNSNNSYTKVESPQVLSPTHATEIPGKTSDIPHIDRPSVRVPENELPKLYLPSTTPLAEVQQMESDIEIRTEDKSISVYKPDGNNDWMGGNSYLINWSGAHLDSRVKIDLVKIDPRYEKIHPIVASTENDGNFEFQVPEGISWPHWHNRVRVSSLDGSVEGFSRGFSVFTDELDMDCLIMDVKQVWESEYYVVYAERDEWLEFDVWLRNLGTKRKVDFVTVLVRLIKEPENVVVFQEEWGLSDICPMVWYKTPEPRKVNISSFRMWEDWNYDVDLSEGSYRLEVEVDPSNRLGEKSDSRDNNTDEKTFRIK